MYRIHIQVAFFCLSLALAALADTNSTRFTLYRSTDQGRSWTQAGEGLPRELRIEALAGRGDLRFAGTERGIFKSDDDGRSWARPRNTVTEDLHVFDFADAGDRIHAATSRGVWTSADGGETWTSAGRGLERTRILSLVSLPGILIAGTSLEGVFMRGGNGAWERIDAGLPPGAQVFELAVEQGEVFAAMYARGIFRLDLAARRWNAAGEEFPLRLATLNGVLYSGRNPCGVYSSGDRGKTWTETSQGLAHRAPTWTLASTRDTVLIGTRGPSGLMRFDPRARTWRPSDRGLPGGAEAVAFGVAEQSVLAAIATEVSNQ